MVQSAKAKSLNTIKSAFAISRFTVMLHHKMQESTCYKVKCRLCSSYMDKCNSQLVEYENHRLCISVSVTALSSFVITLHHRTVKMHRL